MNGWKERLIKYIEALDEDISPEEAEKLVLTEMDRIKKEASAKAQEHLAAEIVDNHNQLNKSIGMSELVALYRELFYGRQDVFAIRWDNEKAGTHGYAPKCKNEWDRNICGKSMRIKGACKKCAYKENQEITNQFIQQHFTGTGRNALVMGVYPLLEDETCRFLAIDFDKKNWQEEILIAKSIYEEYGIKSYIERSRSGNGGHLWIFFNEPIEARLARKLGTKILETAINRTGSSKFDSFDRLFPNQDYMPKGGYGNLIALPLQRQAVENGNSVFVDDTFKMYSSQTAVLQSIVRYSRSEILHVLKLFPDVVLQEVNNKELAEEDRTLPWEKKKEEKVPTNLPKSIDVVLYDKIYVSKNKLHPFLKKKFIGLTVFHNPEYYLARNLRKSVQDIPMWIQCFDEDSEFLMLPIGLEETFVEICGSYHVKVNVIDKRYQGKTIDVNFYGDLREKQVIAVEELLAVSNGILHANTAFGKTVAAIALIAERKVNTLIIVDRISLLEQWRERLAVFLSIPKNEIGVIGGGKKKPTGNIDVAVSQSLYRDNKVSDFIKGYGQIICDECHHVSAVGFEQIMKNSPAKYKYGLTATLKRKDGKERIVLMQLGPVRYKDLSKVTSELGHKVLVQETGISMDASKAEYTTNEIYDYLYINPIRNTQILMDVRNCLDEKRYPIILTERKEHIELLGQELSDYVKVYKLHGGLKKKEREAIMEELQNLPESEKRVIIATSKYVGEGFDYPILDTLFLTLPISWSGRVKQYAGRLHREYHEKKEVRIYDYVDSKIDSSMKMYGKRCKGYRSMGYEIVE
ncbi:MAG: DEAD/DEAH box helicase family protein [Schaedlerella sp.]|nr:DEAD/DEAH box helicase family protein [Schaedlerella sp.]